MAGPVYANLQDYREWSGDNSAMPKAALLARASEDIDDVLTTSIYLTDDDGAPTETVDIEALRDATCAQVQAFLIVGDTAGTGASTQWESAKIGSLSLTGRKTAAPPGAVTTTGRPVASAALQILRRAGLLGHGVTAHG